MLLAAYMAFALKLASSPSSSAPVSSQRWHGAVAVAPAAVPGTGRLVVRALAAASPEGRFMVKTRAPAAPVPDAADRRSLSVAQTLSSVREKGKTAFIPYITAGDPDLETTAAALRLLEACGADVIELGIPFSDPYADGPVIQASTARALAAGATTDAIMSMLREVTPDLSCPVVIFSYFKPIVQQGTARFTAAARAAGVRGLIVPDLPYDEMRALRRDAIKNDIELILLTTPSTTTERMKEITQASEGFVYLVSIDGVTGARATVNPRVKDLLKQIKQVTDKAVAVGFGISTPHHVSQIAEWGGDGVIIGSAMVKELGEAACPREGLERLEVYARSLKEALP